LVFHLGDAGATPRLHLDLEPELAAMTRMAGEGRIVFLVARAAVIRIGGRALVDADGTDFHLPSDLRAIVLALRDAKAPAETRATYRLAKSIELLCETIRQFDSDTVVPLAIDAELSLADTRRLLQARRLIDERWNEKLTLDSIARACGLNRAKLTRGFREMFDCSVAEALAERRLAQASRLLLTTDLPVSSVGYEAGYLNNASFARAFGRHFGRSPSDYRAGALVAA
jgi:AraC family transcriptional activator of pyochelin receptor